MTTPPPPTTSPNPRPPRLAAILVPRSCPAAPEPSWGRSPATGAAEQGQSARAGPGVSEAGLWSPSRRFKDPGFGQVAPPRTACPHRDWLSWSVGGAFACWDSMRVIGLGFNLSYSGSFLSEWSLGEEGLGGPGTALRRVPRFPGTWISCLPRIHTLDGWFTKSLRRAPRRFLV